MRLPLTPRPLRADLSAAVKRLVARTLEDHERSIASVAVELGYGSGSIPERWLSSAWPQHHCPLWALANARAIPDAVFEAVVEGLRAIREPQRDRPVATPLQATTTVAIQSTGLAGVCLEAIRDGRIDTVEREALRRKIAQEREALDLAERALEQHGGSA